MFKRIYVVILLIFPFHLYAVTEIVRTIRADGTGNYTSLAAWEAAENKDLVAADQIATARIEGTWASPSSNVTIAGWTTDATHYIRIYTTPEARHSGVWDDTKFRLTSNGRVLDVQAPYTRLEGLQITAGVVDDVLQHGIDANSGGQTGLWVSQCIVRLSSAVVTYSYAQGITLAEGGTGNARIFNNIVYGFKTANKTSNYGIFVALIDNPALVYNNTVVGCDVGYGGVWGRTVTAKNNIAQNCDVGYEGISGGNNNLTSLSDAPGTSSKQGATVSFVDAANKNYHLASGDVAARDAGADLSADPVFSFTTDIEGETRAGAWDMGADENGGSGGGDVTNPTVSAVTVPGAPSVSFGSSQRITWTANDNVGVVRCSLWVSLDGGSTYSFIGDTSASQITSGAKTWIVPSTATTTAKIRVRAHDAAGNKGEAVSSTFTIANSSIPTSVVLQSPNGDEAWAAASTQTVSWTAAGSSAIAACSLFFSTDNAVNWTPIWNASGNPGTYAWQLPQVVSALCIVKVVVRNAAGSTASDVSDGPFSITRAPFITSPDSVVVQPGGDLSYTFTFDAGGQSGKPSFELLNSASVPYRVFGTQAIGPVAATPVPRVDTLVVRFTLGTHTQDFKLRVMVGMPLGIASRAAAPNAMGLAVQQAKNYVNFLVRIEQPGPCEIAVYDIAGSRIWGRHLAKALPGSFSLSWNPEGAPNSVFIAELRNNGRSVRRSFRIVK